MRAIVAAQSPQVQVSGQLHALRTQLERAQGRRLDAPPLPVHSALAALLPGGGLRPGSAYSITPSSMLVLVLMAQASRSGAWCAGVGMPELGAEAGEQLGVDLSRLVLVPEPGPRWLAVTATIAEVMQIVAVRPPTRASDADVSRLSARLRDRGAVLLVQGPWPQAEAMLALSEPEWTGLGRGHGHLDGRALTVTASSRRWPVPRSARLRLPDVDGGLAPVVERATLPVVERASAASETERSTPTDPVAYLEAVG